MPRVAGRVGDSDLRGAFTATRRRDDRLMLDGDFLTRRLDFDDLMAVLGGAPDPSETASPEQRAMAAQLAAQGRLLPDARLDISRVRNMDARLAASDVSLQAPVSGSEENGASHIDFLASDAPLPDEEVTEMIDGERRRQWLHRALERLNEREMKIIRARRLADSSSTLEELGADLGISKERVRQIENRAMEKLRIALCEASPAFA